MDMLHPDLDDFLQRPSRNHDKFDKMCLGINSIGNLMKVISEKANLNKMYTNHCIRKITATGMKYKGFNLQEIANVTEHVNLESLKQYISAPTHKEKENYCDGLYWYTKNNKEVPAKKLKATPQNSEMNVVANAPNAQPKIVPFEPNFDEIQHTQNVDNKSSKRSSKNVWCSYIPKLHH